MGLILKFAEDEVDLPEFEDCWETFRTLSANGIFKAAEYEIRNLHAGMSMMLSHKLLQEGTANFEEYRQKLFLEMKKSELLFTKYNSGTVSANNSAVMSDLEYKAVQDTYLQAKHNQLIMESEIKALNTAVISLSRELSARFKDR